MSKLSRRTGTATRLHVNINERTCTCTEWYSYRIACRHGLKVWDVYHAQQKDIEFAEYGRRKQELAVDQKPWFLAQKFIEAAAIFENNLIMLPPDADIVEDDKLFPPPCSA